MPLNRIHQRLALAYAFAFVALAMSPAYAAGSNMQDGDSDPQLHWAWSSLCTGTIGRAMHPPIGALSRCICPLSDIEAHRLDDRAWGRTSRRRRACPTPDFQTHSGASRIISSDQAVVKGEALHRSRSLPWFVRPNFALFL
jgi:hypothetical protein